MPRIVKRKVKATYSAAEEIRALARVEEELSGQRHRIDKNGELVAPTPDYWQAVEDLLSAFDPRALPYARSAMAHWADEYKYFLDADTDSRTEPILPSSDYWRARDEAHVALFTDPPKKVALPPSPAQLFAEKVSSRQIAYEWRLFDESGKPDIEAVQRELETPGSVLTPEKIEERRQFTLAQLGFVYQELGVEAEGGAIA